MAEKSEEGNRYEYNPCADKVWPIQSASEKKRVDMMTNELSHSRARSGWTRWHPLKRL